MNSGAGCNIMPLHSYRSLFRDKEPALPSVFISGYSGSPIKNNAHTQLYSSLSSRYHRSQYSRSDTGGYLIPHLETTQQTGYICFPKITLPKLTQGPITHVHLKATTRVSKFKETSKMGPDLRHPKLKLFDGAELITGKKHNLTITKEYIWKEYNDVSSGTGTLPV